MKKLFFFILIVFLPGCVGAGWGARHPDAGYASFTVDAGSSGYETDKLTDIESTGRSCQSNILGLFIYGDSSLGAAAKAGGIDKISRVDYSMTRVLGILYKVCTIVYGNLKAESNKSEQQDKSSKKKAACQPRKGDYHVSYKLTGGGCMVNGTKEPPIAFKDGILSLYSVEPGSIKQEGSSYVKTSENGCVDEQYTCRDNMCAKAVRHWGAKGEYGTGYVDATYTAKNKFCQMSFQVVYEKKKK